MFMSASFIRGCATGTLVAALLSSPASVYGRGPPPQTVGVDLTQAISSVENVSAHAATNANDAVLDAAARLRLSIEALQYSGEDIPDRRPKDLNAAQGKALAAIQSGVATLQAAADQPAEQARERIEEIRQLTAGLSPAPGQPAIERSSPSILVPSSISGAVFTLTGRGLAKADPRLFFGEVEAARTSLTDQQALFASPEGVLRPNDRVPLSYSGRVLLSDRRCGWFHCKTATRAYTVSVVVLPTHLATVRIGFDRKKTQKIYEQTPAAQGAPASASTDLVYRRRFEYSTEDLTVMSCTTESQAPHAAGYSIDTDTLSATEADHSGEVKWRIVDPSATGFSIELCAQPQIDKMGKTTGAVAVETTWKEFRMGEVVTPREWLDAAGLSWGADIKETLPADTNSLEVDLEYFDGSRASFTETSNDRYVNMTWNPQTRQLVLTPRLRSSIAEID
jgi:hypothetical protein